MKKNGQVGHSQPHLLSSQQIQNFEQAQGLWGRAQRNGREGPVFNILILGVGMNSHRLVPCTHDERCRNE